MSSRRRGERLLGLTGALLQQAQRRRCSVPFVPPSGDSATPDALAAAQGLAVVRGNRMCHLLGADVSKGNALAALKQRLGEPDVKVLALGDSPMICPCWRWRTWRWWCLVRMVPIRSCPLECRADALSSPARPCGGMGGGSGRLLPWGTIFSDIHAIS
ncbi:MAG: hypothetical protein CM15mP116_08510 [Synechococcus sp.]|nr:MAG: hypothetical protein CM15mP116_08510 [Synechococcus sp.]